MSDLQDYYHNRLKAPLILQNLQSNRGDPIFDYCLEPPKEYQNLQSSIHTEQHFSELPSKRNSINRHSWQASRSSQNTPRSSIDLPEYVLRRRSHIPDMDEDMPGLVCNIPASTSRSTSIDSLASYSQFSPYISESSISLDEPKRPKFKRRVSTAPTSHTKRDRSFNNIDDSHHLPPLARKLSQSLSRRYLPQSQAILQTDIHGNIIAFNETAVSVFGAKSTLLRMQALDLLEKTFRTKYFTNLLDKFAHTRLERDSINSASDDKPYTTILLCGKVVPIITKDRTESVASLWLKEKRDSDTTYVWIFEELFESMITVHINASATIERVDGEVDDLYGYTDTQLIGRSVEILIPGWNQMRLASDSGFYDLTYDYMESAEEAALRSDHRRLDVDRINGLKFFGSRSATNATFPVMTKIQEASANPDMHYVKIISMPTIAGPVTISRDGTIKGSNTMFAKYLFGYDLVTIMGKSVAQLLPQFPMLMLGIQTQQLLRIGDKLNHEACYSIHNKYNPTASYFDKTPSTNDYFLAVHRDSTIMNVQMHLRATDVDEIVLWIEFDRSKHPQRRICLSSQSKVTDNVNRIATEDCPPLQPAENGLDARLLQPKRPKPLGAVSSFGSATHKVIQVLDPPDHSYARNVKSESDSENKVPRINVDQFLPRRISFATVVAPHVKGSNIPKYSAETLQTCIDDYITIDSFGQGAYGVVKLAQHKTKEEQARVVIKYVVKSRILVDCWTRDRVLGMMPLEIHILHTLRRIPHHNICQMIDYFEDDDHYYIVMNLHGDGMDLFDFIELNREITQDQVRSIFRQVAEAIQHLHHNKIVHRDIKDENVIIDNHDRVQLIDFGSAAYVKPDRMFETFSGTLDYAAPEILNGSSYQGPPQDIWSLGILLYTLVFKENPFYNIDQAVTRELPKLLDVANGWQGATDLMQGMLSRNITDRLTIDQVLAHPWLRE